MSDSVFENANNVKRHVELHKTLDEIKRLYTRALYLSIFDTQARQVDIVTYIESGSDNMMHAVFNNIHEIVRFDKKYLEDVSRITAPSSDVNKNLMKYSYLISNSQNIIKNNIERMYSEEYKYLIIDTLQNMLTVALTKSDINMNLSGNAISRMISTICEGNDVTKIDFELEYDVFNDKIVYEEVTRCMYEDYGAVNMTRLYKLLSESGYRVSGLGEDMLIVSNDALI